MAGTGTSVASYDCQSGVWKKATGGGLDVGYYYVTLVNGVAVTCPPDHPKLLSVFPYMLNGYRGWLYDATIPTTGGLTTITTNDQFHGYIACAA